MSWQDILKERTPLGNPKNWGKKNRIKLGENKPTDLPNSFDDFDRQFKYNSWEWMEDGNIISSDDKWRIWFNGEHGDFSNVTVEPIEYKQSYLDDIKEELK